MNLLYASRALGGFIAIITLLGLIVADFTHPELSLEQDTIWVLITLISGLLGIDMLLKELPVKIQLGKEEKENK